MDSLPAPASNEASVKRPYADLEEDLSCSICMETFQDPQRLRVQDCFHGFCKQCILAHVGRGNRECPLCRSHFTNQDIQPDTVLRPICEKVRAAAADVLAPAPVPVPAVPVVAGAAVVARESYVALNFITARNAVSTAQRECVSHVIQTMGWGAYRQEILANLDRSPEEFFLLRQAGENKGFCQVSRGDMGVYKDEGYISWVGSLDLNSRDEVMEQLVRQTLPLLKNIHRRAYLYLREDNEPFAMILRKVAAEADMLLREEQLRDKFKFTFDLHRKQSTYVPDFLELRLDSFIMSETHEEKPILDLLFEGGPNLSQAGFRESPREYDDPEFHATHEALPGYAFKGLHREALNRCHDLNLHRVTMGEQLRTFFRVNRCDTFVVPDQWLYHIPGRPRTLSDLNYLVVIMWPNNLVSDEVNRRLWKAMSEATVNQLYLAIRENRFMDAWPGTVKFDTAGRLVWTSTMPVKTLDILRQAPGGDRSAVDVRLAHEIKSTGIIRSLVGNWGEGSYLSDANQRFIRTKL